MEVHGGRTDSAVLVPLFCDADGGCTRSSPSAATICAATRARSRSRAGAGTTARHCSETALREAWEEVGLPAEQVDVSARWRPSGPSSPTTRSIPSWA